MRSQEEPPVSIEEGEMAAHIAAVAKARLGEDAAVVLFTQMTQERFVSCSRLMIREGVTFVALSGKSALAAITSLTELNRMIEVAAEELNDNACLGLIASVRDLVATSDVPVLVYYEQDREVDVFGVGKGGTGTETYWEKPESN